MGIGNWPDPMVKVAKTTVRVGVAAGLALPLALGGNLAMANAAQAATYTVRSSIICSYDVTGRGYAWLEQRSYVDYNWYEETILGYRDYSTRIRIDRVPTQDYKCNVRYA